MTNVLTNSPEKSTVLALISEARKRGFSLAVQPLSNDEAAIIDCSDMSTREILSTLGTEYGDILFLNRDDLKEEGWGHNSAKFYLNYDGESDGSEIVEFMHVPTRSPKHFIIMQELWNASIREGTKGEENVVEPLPRPFTDEELSQIEKFVDNVIHSGMTVAYCGLDTVGEMAFYDNGTQEEFMRAIDVSMDFGRIYLFDILDTDGNLGIGSGISLNAGNSLGYVELNRAVADRPLISNLFGKFGSDPDVRTLERLENAA